MYIVLQDGCDGDGIQSSNICYPTYYDCALSCISCGTARLHIFIKLQLNRLPMNISAEISHDKHALLIIFMVKHVVNLALFGSL